MTEPATPADLREAANIVHRAGNLHSALDAVARSALAYRLEALAEALDVAERERPMDVMQDDLADLLRALGMFDGARPESPHAVMQEAIAEVKRRLAAPPPQPNCGPEGVSHTPPGTGGPLPMFVVAPAGSSPATAAAPPPSANAEKALGELWALWNDLEWCRRKADYLRGHLSYAGMLDEKEATIIAALAHPANAADAAVPRERTELIKLIGAVDMYLEGNAGPGMLEQASKDATRALYADVLAAHPPKEPTNENPR